MMKAWLFQDSRQKRRLGEEKCPWSIGWLDPDGKRRSKRVGSKSMAEKLRLKKETELEHGITAPRSVTWLEFRRRHSEAILAAMSPHNREETEIAFRHFERLMAPKRMQAMTTQTIDLFKTRRKRERGRAVGSTISPATVNKELRHLRAAFNVAEEWGLIARAPKFRMLRELDRDPEFVDDDAFAKLYAACDTMGRPGTQSYEPAEWWRALLAFAYTTGWRISEILALEWRHVDLETGVAFLPAESTKGKRDIRIELPPVAIDHVARLRSFSPLVFPWPHHSSTLHADFRALKAAAALDFTGAFHRLRFGFCNANVDELPADVLQHLMRHRSASTTRIYINAAERVRRQSTATRVHVPAVLQRAAN